MHLYIWTSIRAIILWSLKALGQRVLALLSGNSFYSSGHCDLDLWPTEPKINRVLLLNKGYHPMKFEGSGSKGTWVTERKRSVTDGQGKNNMSPPEGGGRHNKALIQFTYLVMLPVVKGPSWIYENIYYTAFKIHCLIFYYNNNNNDFILSG